MRAILPGSAHRDRDAITSANMRWTVTFIYLALVAIAIAALTLIFGWSNWLLAILIVLLIPAAIGIAVMFRHRVSWSATLSYLSAISLVAALASQFYGSTTVRSWLLMIWAVLLLAVAIKLFAHPMRKPAWGLFVGFWGVVGVLWLIVIQLFNLTGVLEGGAYTGWAAWPIGFIGVWFFVASATGFGAEPFGPIVDSLGMVTGLLFFGITLATWTSAADFRIAALVVSAVVYAIWIGGLGAAFLELERGPQTAHAVRHPSPT
jgi:hypothetical protein